MLPGNNCLFTGILLLILLPVSALGESSGLDSEQEINHLLQFIEHSDCTFIRNNESYSGVRAREHIKKKFNYLKKRKKEVSAEQFIKYAASQSSVSKKPYMVNCGTRTLTSESWLIGELEQYRKLSKNHLSTQRAQ